MQRKETTKKSTRSKKKINFEILAHSTFFLGDSFKINSLINLSSNLSISTPNLTELKIKNKQQQIKQQSTSSNSNLQVPSSSSSSSPKASTSTLNASIGLGKPKYRRRRTNSLEIPRIPTEFVGAVFDLNDSSSPSRGVAGGEVNRPHLLRRCTSVDSLARSEGEGDEGFNNEGDQPFRIRPRSSSAASSINSLRPFAIRLDDNSDKKGSNFTKEVKIVGYFPVVGEKKSLGYVVFDCLIHTNENTTIRTLRRYSQFHSLHRNLSEAYPKLKQYIPPLPPKSTLAKYRPSFLEKRRQLLSYWLSAILLHPVYGGSDIVKSFITESEN